MSDKLMVVMVGRVFHLTENGIKSLLKGMLQGSKPKTVFDLSLPVKTWALYVVVGAAVWYLWPNGKAMPNEIWIGVLSFEGLLAALLAAVAPATVTAGLLPFAGKFFSALDAKMGEKITDEIRQVRDDPTHTGNAGAIRNAFIVGLNTLFVLPLPLVLDSKWLAPILAVSLCWTTRAIIPDVIVFVITEYAPILPATYWTVRAYHDDLSYCPVCKGQPKAATWLPPQTTELPQGMPQP